MKIFKAQTFKWYNLFSGESFKFQTQIFHSLRSWAGRNKNKRREKLQQWTKTIRQFSYSKAFFSSLFILLSPKNEPSLNEARSLEKNIKIIYSSIFCYENISWKPHQNSRISFSKMRKALYIECEIFTA